MAVSTCLSRSPLFLDEDQVEMRPEHISDGILDECVNLSLVTDYFTPEGLQALKAVVDHKKRLDTWRCGSCFTPVGDAPSIICDSCLEWHHLSCTSATAQVKKKHWVCSKCSGAPGKNCNP